MCCSFLLDKHSILTLKYLWGVFLKTFTITNPFFTMKATKNSLALLYIFAFIYLVMCPSVHHFGDNIRHDVILKVKVKFQHNYANADWTIETCTLSSKTKTADFDQINLCADQNIQPSFPSLDLSALSTVKLIL